MVIDINGFVPMSCHLCDLLSIDLLFVGSRRGHVLLFNLTLLNDPNPSEVLKPDLIIGNLHQNTPITDIITSCSNGRYFKFQLNQY